MVTIMVKIKKSSWSPRQAQEVHKRCPNKSAKDEDGNSTTVFTTQRQCTILHATRKHPGKPRTAPVPDPHALTKTIVVKIEVKMMLKVMVKIRKGHGLRAKLKESTDVAPTNQQKTEMETAQRPSLHSGNVPSSTPHKNTHASPALHQYQIHMRCPRPLW